MSRDVWVRIPIAGIVAVYVEDVESDEDAIKKAMTMEVFDDIKMKDGCELDEIDLYRNLTTGNVLYAPLNSIEIEDD